MNFFRHTDLFIYSFTTKLDREIKHKASKQHHKHKKTKARSNVKHNSGKDKHASQAVATTVSGAASDAAAKTSVKKSKQVTATKKSDLSFQNAIESDEDLKRNTDEAKEARKNKSRRKSSSVKLRKVGHTSNMTMIEEHLKTITKQVSEIMNQNNKSSSSNAKKKYGIARLSAIQQQQQQQQQQRQLLLTKQQQQQQQLHGKKAEMARMSNPITYSSNSIQEQEAFLPMSHVTYSRLAHDTKLIKDFANNNKISHVTYKDHMRVVPVHGQFKNVNVKKPVMAHKVGIKGFSNNNKISHVTYKDHMGALPIHRQVSTVNLKKPVALVRKVGNKNVQIGGRTVHKQQDRYKPPIKSITPNTNLKQNLSPKYKQIVVTPQTNKITARNKTTPKLALTFNDFTLDNLDFKGLHFSHGIGDELHVGNSDEFSLDTGHSSEKFRDNAALYFAGRQHESTYHKCCLDYCEASSLPKCDPQKQIIPLPTSSETAKEEKVTPEQEVEKKHLNNSESEEEGKVNAENQEDKVHSTGDGRHFIRHEPYTLHQHHGISYGDHHDEVPFGYYGGDNEHHHDGGLVSPAVHHPHHLSNSFPLSHSHSVNRDWGIDTLDHHHAGASHPSILPPHRGWHQLPDHGIGMLSHDHHHAGATDTHILANGHGDWAPMPDHGIGMLSHDHHHAGTDSEHIFPHHGPYSLSNGPDYMGNLHPHYSHRAPYHHRHRLGSHYDHGISSGPDHLGNLYRHHTKKFSKDINEMGTIDKVLSFDRLQEHHCKGSKRHRIEARLRNQTVADANVPGIECLIQKNMPAPPPTPGIIPDEPSRDHGISALLGYLNSDAPGKSDIKPPPAVITDTEEEGNGFVVGTPISITEGDETESQYIDKNHKLRHQTAIGNYSNGVLSLVGNEQPPPATDGTKPDSENVRHRKKNKDEFEESSENVIIKKFNENLRKHEKGKQRVNVDDNDKDDDADQNYSKEDEEDQENEEEEPQEEKSLDEDENENQHNRTSEEPDKFRGNVTDEKSEQEGKKYNEVIDDEPKNDEENADEGNQEEEETKDQAVQEVGHYQKQHEAGNEDEQTVGHEDEPNNDEVKNQGTTGQMERTANESSEAATREGENMQSDNDENKHNNEHQNETKEAQNDENEGAEKQPEDKNQVSLKYEEDSDEAPQKNNEGEEDIKNSGNAYDDREPSSDESSENLAEKNNENDEVDRHQDEAKNHSSEDDRFGTKKDDEYEENSRSRPENQNYKEENPDDEYRISSDDQENLKHDRENGERKEQEANNEDEEDKNEDAEPEVHNRSRNNHNADPDDDDEDDRRSSKRMRVERESVRTKRSTSDSSSSKKKEKKKKTDIKHKGNLTHIDFDIPNNIPTKCGKLVKSYTNGEMTLKDYLKELKICKKNEEVEAKLANTTPQQREAVKTMSMIQQEAYKYAMQSMRSFKSKDAESVMDKWRSDSFGDKEALKKSEGAGAVPDAVKKFMTMQTHTENAANNIINPTAEAALVPNPKTLLTLQANANLKPSIANPALQNLALLGANNDVVQPNLNGAANAALEGIAAIKNTLPQAPLVNADLLAKKSVIPNQQQLIMNKANAYLDFLAKKNLIQQNKNAIPQNDMLLQAMINKGILAKKSMIPQAALNALKLPAPKPPTLNPANLPVNSIENPVPIPTDKKIIASKTAGAEKAPEKSPIDKKTTLLLPVSKLSEIDKVLNGGDPKASLLAGSDDAKVADPAAIAAVVEAVKKSEIPATPDAAQTNLINQLKSKETTATKTADGLSADKLAAEQFFASLANPVLDNMPVDTNLIAALNGMGGMESPYSPEDEGHLLQVSRRRRQLYVKRLRKHHAAKARQQKLTKRSVDARRTTRHRRDIEYVLTQSKRATTDNLTSAKPIERSNMGVHISEKQGPKLLDKIRDISRVIATK